MGGVKPLKFLFDECVPASVAEALALVGADDVVTMLALGKLGTKDDKVAELCSKQNFILVTKDRNQLVRVDDIAALREHSVRAVYLPDNFGNATLWDTLFWFLKHWKGIAVQARELHAGGILLSDLAGKTKLCESVDQAVHLEDRRRKARARRRKRAQ